jgi:hypothetical protein
MSQDGSLKLRIDLKFYKKVKSIMVIISLLMFKNKQKVGSN